MDTIRQVRFLIAPFFFFSSLLIGAYLGGNTKINDIAIHMKDYSAAIIAVVITALFPFGFLIGALTIFLIDLGYKIKTKRREHHKHLSYDMCLGTAAMTAIWKKVEMPKTVQLGANLKDAIYAGYTFDHEVLSQGIHEWTLRTWTAFSISANSVTAFALAFIIGCSTNIITFSFWWLVITVICIAILTYNAKRTWNLTMKMLEFQAQRKKINYHDKK